MDASRSGQLGDALDGAFHVVLGHHHHICHLIDHDKEIGVRSHLPVGPGRRMDLAFADGFVEVFHVLETEELQVVIAGVHLFDHPFQGLGGPFGIGDDGGQQVGDAGVGGQLHPLGVDHDHPDLFRGGPHDDGHEHGVDEAGLS